MAFLPFIYNPNFLAGSVFQLPVPINSWVESHVIRNTVRDLPGANGSFLLQQSNAPTRIQIRGEIVGWDTGGAITVAAARTKLHLFEAAVRGPFWLFRYNDSGFYECVAESFASHRTNEPDDVFEYDLTVLALNPYRYTGLGVEGANLPSSGGWDYGSTSGGGINVGDGAGGTVIQAMNPVQPIFAFFPGIAADTPAGGEGVKRYVAGDAGAILEVARLGVSAVSGAFGTGTTTVRVAKAARGSELGTYMEVSLSESATNAVTTTGAFEVTPGDYLYFTVSGAVHADIQCYVDVEVTTA